MKKIFDYCIDLATEDVGKHSKNKYHFLFNLIILKPICNFLLLITTLICIAWAFTGFGILAIMIFLNEGYYIPALVILIIDLLFLIDYIKEKLKNYEHKN